MELETHASVSDNRRAPAFGVGFLVALALVPIGIWKLGAVGGTASALLALGCLVGVIRTGIRRALPIVVSAGEIVIGTQRIARSDLVAAEIVGGNPLTVRLDGKRVRADIEVADERQAVAIVRALGLSHALPATWVDSPASSVTGVVRIALLAVALVLALLAVVQGSAALGAGAVAFFGASMFGRTLRVGDDGVHLDGRLESDFFSYATILRVDATPTGITLHLDAETISLTMTTSPGSTLARSGRCSRS